MERYRRFIELWFTSASLAEVAAAMGMDRRACSNLAAALRRCGVKLPKHALYCVPPRFGPRLNWLELRALADGFVTRREEDARAAERTAEHERHAQEMERRYRSA